MHQPRQEKLSRAHRVLRSVFGYTSFRPLQEEIIETVIGGSDAFVLMPTGGGKSLCFQIPGMVRNGLAVVVSPLISLMKDQVDSLRHSGVPAAYYNSGLGAREARSVLAKLHNDRLAILYVSPERLAMPDFMARLEGRPIALLAIDEAHCVSQWGHDFRPEYVQLGRIRNHPIFRDVPCIALTATADPHTREDILSTLQLQSASQFVASFDRPNIRYTIVQKKKPKRQLTRFLKDRRDECGIVYCLSRKRVEQVAALLRKEGFAAEAYHAGLASGERQRVQDAFIYDNSRIIVATVAFGMGIDKPNVRFVVHYDLPKNIESYYQETGRAGRDGLPSEALLLFGLGDIAVARSLIEKSNNAQQVRIESHKLNAMVNYAGAETCRRKILLSYFDEQLDEDCGNCDICLDPPELFDATLPARKALSCVFRVRQNFGMGHVISVLRGENKAQIRRWRHDQLSTYGIGSDMSKAQWSGIIRQLIHRGYLVQDMSQYSVLKLTPQAAPLLRGETTLHLAKPRNLLLGSKKKKKKLKKGEIEPLTAEALPLFESLRAVRRDLAADAGVPAYVIFSDATLSEMSRLKPSSIDDLLNIPGVGKYKMTQYGQPFLDTIQAYLQR